MSRIYTNTNKIKFTQISDKYKVNRAVKGKLSELHALLITYVVKHFKNTNKYKKQVVYSLNVITYALYADEVLPFDWSPSAPFDNVPEIDDELIQETLGDIYLTVEGIDWDVTPKYDVLSETTTEANSSNNSVDDDTTKVSCLSSTVSPSRSKDSDFTSTETSTSIVVNPTPKQDLYIQPPVVPQFDYKRPWMSGSDGVDKLVIYTTLPEIPSKQNQISVTTDVTKMRSSELMALYPNRIVNTRSSIMYEPVPGIRLDPDLGLILPIDGFTEEDVIDNIIRYPHIFKLSRMIDGQQYSFYSHIEIDGELLGTLDVWNTLPESSVIPRQAEFVKEYVVRRYLLERDKKGIHHKYPMYGDLDEFLTLFMTSDEYIRRGYTDVEEIARKCVLSRVAYKQSRNPVIRRLQNV